MRPIRGNRRRGTLGRSCLPTLSQVQLLPRNEQRLSRRFSRPEPSLINSKSARLLAGCGSAFNNQPTANIHPTISRLSKRCLRTELVYIAKLAKYQSAGHSRSSRAWRSHPGDSNMYLDLCVMQSRFTPLAERVIPAGATRLLFISLFFQAKSDSCSARSQL